MVTRGKSVFSRAMVAPKSARCPEVVNDLLLYALFARVTLTPHNEQCGRTIEFSTSYDAATRTVELEVADDDLKFFDQLTGVQRGPRFQKFINWLIGSRQFESTVTPDFVSATAFDFWYGATPTQMEDVPLVLFPTVEPSAIGYNAKLRPTSTKAVISATWKFVCGSGSSLTVRVVVTVISPDQDPYEVVHDAMVSTAGLSAGDVFDTDLLSLSVPAGSVLALSMMRNFSGSTDPHSEMVGLIGVRISDE